MGLDGREVDKNMKPIKIAGSVFFILAGLTDLGSGSGLLMFGIGAVFGFITFLEYK